MAERMKQFIPVLAALAVAGATFLTPLPAGWAQEAEREKRDGIDDADCAKIPGGNAPVNVLARIQGGMAVENLEFTYFEKKLFELTADDFEYLAELIPYCRDQPSEQTEYILARLWALVSEAQTARQKSIDWIEETVAKLEKLPGNQESIREIHNIWVELQNRQLEMTKADTRYMSKKLNEERDRIYQEAASRGPAAPGPDTGVKLSPFQPEIFSDEDRKPDPS